MAGLHRSIDALRDAPNHDKAPYLDELRSKKCTSPRLCELKRVCTLAYSRHLAALGKVGKINATGANAPGAKEALQHARQALIEAERLTQRCVALQADLRDPKKHQGP